MAAEASRAYLNNSDFDPENRALSDENIYYWNESSEISTC